MPNWDSVRSEYIAGGISQRKLAAKYGINWRALEQRAKTERWTAQRKEARRRTIEMTVQKTADAATENAATAQRIRAKLLARIEREIDALPDDAGSGKICETSEPGRKKGSRITTRREQKLRDLAAAYKDLTADIPVAGEGGGNELLESIYDVLNRKAE